MKIQLKAFAQTLQDTPLHLPHSGGAVNCWSLKTPTADEPLDSYYFCLEGELLIDLPHGDFVHLKPREAAHIEGGKPRKLTPVGQVLLVTVRL